MRHLWLGVIVLTGACGASGQDVLDHAAVATGRDAVPVFKGVERFQRLCLDHAPDYRDSVETARAMGMTPAGEMWIDSAQALSLVVTPGPKPAACSVVFTSQDAGLELGTAGASLSAQAEAADAVVVASEPTAAAQVGQTQFALKAVSGCVQPEPHFVVLAGQNRWAAYCLPDLVERGLAGGDLSYEVIAFAEDGELVVGEGFIESVAALGAFDEAAPR